MDISKDTNLTILSKFLDVQIRTDAFGENLSGERAYRRGERLVAALFLLTKHIPTDEPIRAETRRIAASILPQILALRDDMRAVGSRKVSEFQATVRLLISLIKMLLFAGYVSSQNAQSACEALDDLGTFISVSQRSNLSESMKFSHDDLLAVQEARKGQIKDIRDKQTVKDNSSIKDSRELTNKLISPMSPALGSRAGSIVALMRAGGDFNVKDISSSLPEYSEKTIQREISLLVKGGLVRRTGLKRWSRYSIA